MEYQYRRLEPKSVRLLYLDNSEKSLTGHFIEHDASSRVAYRVLSYTWTPKIHCVATPIRLWLDGQFLELDPTVAAFMMALDSDQASVPLWIDAICIDQGNAAEKLHQIPMMGMIYSNALQCIVWLGAANQPVEEALASIPEINTALNEYDSGSDNSHLNLNMSMPISLITHMNGLCSIVTRTWFRRLWTMQEYVLPRDIIFMCGMAKVTDEQLGRFIELYNMCNYQANEALMKPEMYVAMFCEGSPTHLSPNEAKDYNAFVRYPPLHTLRKARQESRRIFGLALPSETALFHDLTVLITTFEKRATVPSDNILGLLGMLRMSGFSNEVPISITCTEIDVFVAATAVVLKQQHSSRSLCLLHYTDTLDRLPGLPSWAPNYHSSQRLHTLSPLTPAGQYLYAAGCGSDEVKRERVQFAGMTSNGLPTMIRLWGRVIDQIAAVVDGESSGWEDVPYATWGGKEQEAWERRCNALAREHARGKVHTQIEHGIPRKRTINKAFKDYPDCYRSTLSAGSVKKGKGHKRAEPSDQTYKEFVWRLSRLAAPDYNDFYTRLHESEHPGVKVNWDFLTGKNNDHTKPLYTAKEKEEYHARIFEVCRRRSFFVTTEGRLGIGGRVKVGDVIVLFAGARTPFVVRDVVHGQGTHSDEAVRELIGEAYVHGIMDGEAYVADSGRDEWITLA